MSRPPRHNNPAEIEAFDRVCERLAGFDGRLSSEWIDGYMTAVAAGPLAPTLADWLPAMAGDAFERSFADPEDRLQGERALQARMAALLDQLDAEALFDDPDALRLAPLMVSWDEAARTDLQQHDGLAAEEAAEFVTGADWADGFFAALDDHLARWAAKPDDEQAALYGDLLRQVQALQFADGSDELKQHVAEVYQGQDELPDRERLVDEACYAVQDLRCWWVDQAPKPETRRVGKTPGRNDPCPCGSGKKFKKCHGA